MTSPNTKRRRKKHNKESESEENDDRISDLPDCVRLHILSLLDTRHAVQTCILSTRWKHLWKRLPTLTLSSSHFKTLRYFTKFVSDVFYLRDASTALHDLDFHRKGFMEPHLLKRIVNYAASHYVQRLRIDVTCDIGRLPPCIFSCQTLTSLSISVRKPTACSLTPLFPNTLNLPALTSLYLENFTFRGGKDGRADPFSACNRLNSLIIYHCRVLDAENLCISSTTLVNLTIYNGKYYPWCNCKIEISAPSLCRFAFTGPLQKLYGRNLSSIKQMNIEADLAWYNPAETPLVLLSWLIGLSDIKSLTVSSNTLQVLSLVPDLLKVKLPSLCNLKSLKVITEPPSYELCMMLRGPNPGSWNEAAKIPDGIVDFLLQNSPLAKVDIIDWSRKKTYGAGREQRVLQFQFLLSSSESQI